jgi:hypothetical protein
MPEFILDTNGRIALRTAHTPFGSLWTRWEDLRPFTQGYIEALFFTESEPGTTHLAPEALARIIADCTAFQADHGMLIEACAEFSENLRPDNDDVWTRAGRDYWFTRNGHGVGFWLQHDRWPPPHGDALDAAAKRAGEMDAYLGDDGKVHVS